MTSTDSEGRLLPTKAAQSPLSHSTVDALAWFLVTALILSVIPIGTVSGDGLAQSASFSRGTWYWNPNHLLMEPLGAWWQTTLTRLGSARIALDQLKLLSVVSGAAALALFRWGVAAPISPGRLAANHATLWVALSSGFSRLWISDEIHMIQMPALALLAVASLHYLRGPSLMRAVLFGCSIGMASLFFVSNALIGVSLAVVFMLWLMVRRQPRRLADLVIGVGAGSTVVAGSAFVLAWLFAAPAGTGLMEWLTSYGGGRVSGRAASIYGMDFDLGGFAVAAARAVYGAASALVDLAPVVEVVRDDLSPSGGTALNVAAFLGAATLMFVGLGRAMARRAQIHPGILLLTLGWAGAVFGFGTFWNNSDDQFYFQLAIPFGVIIATLPRLLQRQQLQMLSLFGLLALAWNAIAFAQLISYPRTERIASLEGALREADLVIYPGMDEIHQILSFIPEQSPGRRVALTAVATSHPPDQGYQLLRARLEAALGHGHRVAVVGIFDVPRDRNPWKALRALGYDQARITELLGQFPVADTSTYAGPFTVRLISPPPDASDPNPLTSPAS